MTFFAFCRKHFFPSAVQCNPFTHLYPPRSCSVVHQTPLPPRSCSVVHSDTFFFSSSVLRRNLLTVADICVNKTLRSIVYMNLHQSASPFSQAHCFPLKFGSRWRNYMSGEGFCRGNGHRKVWGGGETVLPFHFGSDGLERRQLATNGLKVFVVHVSLHQLFYHNSLKKNIFYIFSRKTKLCIFHMSKI